LPSSPPIRLDSPIRDTALLQPRPVNWSTRGSEDEDCFIAVVPSLPGCSAFGGTSEALMHRRMIMKAHRDTQSRGFAWLLGSFGNFGPWRRPGPQ
jgi:hypothetical protein